MFNGKCENCGKSITFDDGIKVGGNYIITTSGTWFCSNRCKDEFKTRNSSSTAGANQSQSDNNNSNDGGSEKKSGGFLGGLTGGGEDSSSKLERAKMFTSLFADTMNENKDIRAKVDAVSKMVFSTDANELGNQMNELLTIGAGTDSKHKELIKACYEKMDFGVMKLKGLGATAESEFFAKKRESIKPKGIFGF